MHNKTKAKMCVGGHLFRYYGNVVSRPFENIYCINFPIIASFQQVDITIMCFFMMQVLKIYVCIFKMRKRYGIVAKDANNNY